MHEYDEVHGAYIAQDLLEDTSTASALALIGQLHDMKVNCIGAESVQQNCVIGRCAYLHIATESVVVLNELILTVSTFGGCGSLERTDF